MGVNCEGDAGDKFLRRVVSLFLIAFALLLATGCSLLEPQPELVIPTPVPTAPPLESLTGEVVIDPVSDVVPTVDPIVTDLLNQVSQQQLMAYVRQMQDFGTRNAFSATDSETFGIGAARRWIFNEFVRVGNGRMQVEFQDFPLSYDGLSSEQSNVVATLPGTGSGNGVIVVVAHYDNRPVGVTDGVSRATGANDNGSGIALLLETARVMSSRDWNQTIIFLATSGEEQGGFGARYFAQNAFLDNMNILAVINYDAIGGRAGIGQYVRLFAEDFLNSTMGSLGRYYEYIAGLYLPTFPVRIIDALIVKAGGEISANLWR
ncbi:MAG: M20/M25/M40 family metallo-hydrolase [Chloroflexota bacterium]